MSERLEPSSRAAGLMLGPGVVVPDDASIGTNVVIHAGSVLGAGVRLEHGAVVGRPPAAPPGSRSRAEPARRTELGARAHVGVATVIGAGSRLGPGAYVGDHCLIRETVTLERDVVVGHGGAIAPGAVIGARTRIQNNALIAHGTTVEADVMVSGNVVFTDDMTIGRHGSAPTAGGATLRRGCRVGAGAILMPGIEIGEESLVGAGSLVRADVPPRTVVVGAPARPLRAVTGEELLENWPR